MCRTIATGIPLERTSFAAAKGVVCIACNGTAPHAYIREQSKAGNMGEQMTAIVAEGDRKRVFSVHRMPSISESSI